MRSVHCLPKGNLHDKAQYNQKLKIEIEQQKLLG